MHKAVYAVLQIESEWRIVCARRQIGRFDNRTDALKVAAGLVKQAIQAGLNAELLVLDAAWRLVGEHFRPGREESLELAAA